MLMAGLLAALAGPLSPFVVALETTALVMKQAAQAV